MPQPFPQSHDTGRLLEEKPPEGLKTTDLDRVQSKVGLQEASDPIDLGIINCSLGRGDVHAQLEDQRRSAVAGVGRNCARLIGTQQGDDIVPAVSTAGDPRVRLDHKANPLGSLGQRLALIESQLGPFVEATDRRQRGDFYECPATDIGMIGHEAVPACLVGMFDLGLQRFGRQLERGPVVNQLSSGHSPAKRCQLLDATVEDRRQRLELLRHRQHVRDSYHQQRELGPDLSQQRGTRWAIGEDAILPVRLQTQAATKPFVVSFREQRLSWSGSRFMTTLVGEPGCCRAIRNAQAVGSGSSRSRNHAKAMASES